MTLQKLQSRKAIKEMDMEQQPEFPQIVRGLQQPVDLTQAY
jgi:hypothetical protein